MKKILSLILALIMMLSGASMIFADTVISDAAPVETDETASAYYEAVQFLVAYDIMHGKGEGNLGVYDNIQRYEMALFMGRILSGWTDDSTWEDGTLNSSEFTDLEGTAAENYYGAISYVNQKGIIEGYGNGKFGPTNGITYQDAITMAVRALGYNDLTYPWGYIEAGINLGVTAGISGVVYTETLKREVVAQIIYNTLFAENKAGETLAETVFDLNLAWTNIIITETDLTGGEVPAGYVGFSVLNDDGTIDGTTYYVEAAQLGLTGDHDDEKAWGTVYKVMFDTKSNNGLNTVISYKSLELDTVDNSGRLEMTTSGYPIQAFLNDYDIVSKYTVKNYLNTTPEIMIADGNGALGEYEAANFYAVDWATGNILYIDLSVQNEMWYCVDYYNKDNKDLFTPDYTLAGIDYKYGLIDQKGATWCISDAEGNYICPDCKYYYDEHTSTNIKNCDWIKDVSAGVVTTTTAEVVWYYNEKLDAYFYLKVTDTVNGVPVLGVIYMTEAQRAELEVLLNTVNAYDYERIEFLHFIETDASALNAYASLRLFDTRGDELADYGIYEEYRFAVIANTTAAYCAQCKANVAGYTLTDVSGTPMGATNTITLTSEAGCKHGQAWISDGAEVVDGSYVIYGYNQATGELKIVKTISGTIDEDEDNYVGHGYIRAYNVTNNQITIAGEKLSYNYPQLKGSITEAMLTTHVNHTNNKAGEGFPAIANRYLDGLLNQYVEYVVVDGRLVYIELEGASNNLIVVETYAGIHEDGAIVVWGYEVGADKTETKLEQFRIASYNGWANGDWYNYSFYNEDVIAAAFERGAVYQIKSYDEDVKGYNVQVLTSVGDDYNYAQYGTWTELYYEDAKVGGMSVGAKTVGEKVQRIMKSTDKYVFIYDITNVDGYNAIPITTYTGIVSNPEAYAKGYRVANADGTFTDGTYIMYIDDIADIKGFSGAAEQGYGLVMFLEWGSSASYDEANGKNYLVGSTVRTAYVFDFFTAQLKEVTVYPGNYKMATTKGGDGGSLKDGYTDNLALGHVWFSDLSGYIYQTVNGVVVDDTPVDPADVPAIIAEAVTGTNILTDSLVLETGTVIARLNGENLHFDKSLNSGYDGEAFGDYEGFCAMEINRRMTLKALGVAYVELMPYTLGRDQKAAVMVRAIKANDDGTASIHFTAEQNGNKKLGVQVYYTDRTTQSLVDFFGDGKNQSQAYNYSLIYSSDINGDPAAKQGDSKSKAVVWLYDFDDSDALKNDNVSTEGSQIDGFVAPGYTYPETPVIPEAITPEMATAKDGLDNVAGYFDLGEGVDVSNDYLVLDAAQSALSDGSFSIAFWMNADGYTGNDSDAAILATQCWDSGSNPGFGLYRDGDKLYLNLCDGNGDNRTKLFADAAEGTWNHVAIVVDGRNVKLYVNGVVGAENTLPESFDLSKLVGENGFIAGWDGDCCYKGRWIATVDEIVVTTDVLAEAEIASLASAR